MRPGQQAPESLACVVSDCDRVSASMRPGQQAPESFLNGKPLSEALRELQ